MTRNERVKKSKFLSLVLRHDPERVSLTLDAAGWVAVDVLLAAVNRHGLALKMHQAGFVFCRSANGVWLVDHVPVQYIDFPSIP